MLFRRVFNFLIVLSTLSFGQAAPAAAGDIEQQTGAQEAYQLAQTNTDDAEKDAFNSAKELGTSEAWQAYLKTYPTGFRADLARAYMKRLGEQGTAPASAPASGAALPPAGELACREAATLRSQNSATPAKVIFINASGAQRRIVWIDFKGSTKEYARLNAGEQLEQDTFLTHPWIVQDASGNCSQVFMPIPGTSVARLGEPEDDHGPTPEQTCHDIGEVYRNGVCVKPDRPSRESSCLKNGGKWRNSDCVYTKKKKYKADPAASCRELGLAYRNGQCVAKSQKDIKQYKKQKKIGCPAGTYLNPLGVCQPNETGG